MNLGFLYGALFFYALAVWEMIKGWVFRYFGWKYATRVKYESFFDLMTNNPMGVLTDFIPWQAWLALWLALGTFILVLAIRAPPDESTEAKN